MSKQSNKVEGKGLGVGKMILVAIIFGLAMVGLLSIEGKGFDLLSKQEDKNRQIQEDHELLISLNHQEEELSSRVFNLDSTVDTVQDFLSGKKWDPYLASHSHTMGTSGVALNSYSFSVQNSSVSAS